jgi:hypothetical protein
LVEGAGEGFGGGFFGCPEVQEGAQVVGLVVQPGEFLWGEPTVGEGGEVSRLEFFEVDAEGAVVRRGDRDPVLRTGEADGETGDVRAAGLVVSEDRVVDEGACEVQQEVVCRAG